MGSVMSREDFKSTGWKMAYEDYLKCYCPDCSEKGCIHREAYRRVPEIDGGLGLCPNLHRAADLIDRVTINGKSYSAKQLTIDWFTNTNDSFFSVYGFNFNPHEYPGLYEWGQEQLYGTAATQPLKGAV